MAAREIRHRFEDMLAAIDGIQRAVVDKTFSDYASDWLLKHAVERAIEIISEASRAVPNGVQAMRPDIPWPRIRAIGNILRHEYHALSDRIIWGVVVDELPRLRDAICEIRTAIDRLD